MVRKQMESALTSFSTKTWGSKFTFLEQQEQGWQMHFSESRNGCFPSDIR